MPQAIKTQASARRDVHPLDQFGREWFGSIELKTGDLTGVITAAGGWRDPLRTPQKFLAMPKDASGFGILGKIHIDIDGWIAENDEAERQWYEQLHIIARDVYKRLDPTDIPQLENDAFVRGLAGRKPWPSTAVLHRINTFDEEGRPSGDLQFLGLEPLDKEHREALGIITLEDTRHIGDAPATVGMPKAELANVPEPPETYAEFVKWAFQHAGCKDLTTVAKLWQEHKAKVPA